MTDPVGAADRLHDAVSGAIDDILAAATAPPGPVFVGWAAAGDAAACPAAYRAQGEDGWGFPGWSPTRAAGAIARAALDLHLDDQRSGAYRMPDPLEAVRAWMRGATSVGARGVAGWVGDLRAERDTATLAAAAAASSRWLAGFVRVLGWPLPAGLALLNVTRDDGLGVAARWWPRKGSPVSVGCGADARIGRMRGAGGHTLVVHRPAAGDDREVHGRASFEAAAGALVHRVAPAAVVVTAGDTGERARVEVDGDMLAAGGGMIVEVVRQRALAVDRGHDPADATPSARCRWCERRDTCLPGRDWLAGAGRWRGGLPVVGPG
ncbi:MAG TPA: hypothetical protein VFH36_00240 [Acidimicrobiales bacterium]|nr:hypothetical protein [Acidimicrobiales bacterium]